MAIETINGKNALDDPKVFLVGRHLRGSQGDKGGHQRLKTPKLR